MAVPTVSWDETSPAGSQAMSLGDDRIREMKTQIREVIDVDHKFSSSGTDADMGCHDQVTLLEKADLGTGAVGKTILGSQTVSGKGELCYVDEDDNTIQITTLGGINASQLVIASQAAADLLVASSATAWGRLAKGTALQYLRTNAGATALEWAADPTFTPTSTNALTGSVVQVVHADGFSKVTGATNFPMDNTTPQITEGTEVMTLAITPKSATNKLKITVVAYVGSVVGNGAGVAVALFNTDFHSTNAIMTGYTHTGNQTSVNSLHCVTFVAYVTAAVTSASTFKVRIGAGTSDVYFNSDLGTDYFNGTFGSSITIEEVKV